MKTNLLGEQFHDEDKAREYLEQKRWNDKVLCPHCGSTQSYRLVAKLDSTKPVRKGVYTCKT
jgi:hypothetical protein